MQGSELPKSKAEGSLPETAAAEAQRNKIDLKLENPGEIVSPNPSGQPGNEQLQDWAQVVSDLSSRLPDLVGDFFIRYKQFLITLGLFVSLIVTVKLTLAVLDAVNDIPLLAPFLELVGIGYTAWFIFRYLVKGETRQELVAEFQALQGQILGKNSLDS
ncbi:MAG: hypothetical protein F6K47_03775 [Symploca sp. SIO2E6]|nr:hypothetical protein [Symploca sp. SIO2E6]